MIVSSTPEGFPKLGARDTVALDNSLEVDLLSLANFQAFPDLDPNEAPLPLDLSAKSTDSHPNCRNSSAENTQSRRNKKKTSRTAQYEETFEEQQENVPPKRRHLEEHHQSRQRHRDSEHHHRHPSANSTNNMAKTSTRAQQAAAKSSATAAKSAATAPRYTTKKRSKDGITVEYTAAKRGGKSRKVDSDEESRDLNDENYDNNFDDQFEDSDDELGEDFDSILQTLPPKKRKVMQRQMEAINNQQKDLKVEVEVATARATAEKQIQSKGMKKSIKDVVKTWLIRTCRFITTGSDLENATNFVFSKIDLEKTGVPLTEQQKANRNATYRQRVSQALCGRRNYHQQQLRLAALAYGLGEEDVPDGEEEEDDATTLDDTAVVAAPKGAERPLFTVEMMTKCATR